MTVAVAVAATRQPTRRRFLDLPASIAAGFLAAVVIAALAAPLIAPYEPDAIDFDAVWAQPSGAHLLGADLLGRDVLSRLLSGAGVSLLGPLALLVIASVVGVAVGLASAWMGGWIDQVLTRITDVMFALPGLLFVVLLVAAVGKGITVAIIGLGIAYFPVIAKFTRSVARAELSMAYVDAYRIQGLGALRICVRYVLPNLVPTLLGYVVVLFGEALMGLAAMSYLGFGSEPPSSEWGLMVQEGQPGLLLGSPWPTIAPALAIALVVLAVNVLGVRVSDRLNRSAR